MKTEPNKPAYPLEKGVAVSDCFSGLTKREHFAGLAMQGLLGTLPNTGKLTENGAKYLAEEAVMAADYLIAELNKEVKP